MHECLHAATAKLLAEPVAIGMANDEQVIDVFRVWSAAGHGRQAQPRQVAVREPPALGVVAVQLLQSDAQECRLQLVETAIESAGLLGPEAARLAVIAEPPHAVRD